MQGLSSDVVLRPRTGRVLAAMLVAIAALAFFGVLAAGDLGLLARAAAPLGLLAFGAWTLFWRPAVQVGPSHVVFVNLLRTVEIAWPAVEEVQTRWSLTLVTVAGTWTAWAAPKPTRVASSLHARRNMLGFVDYSRPDRGDQAAPRATGEVASLVVQQQWSQYRDAGLLGLVEGEPVVVRWHVTTIAVLVVLVGAWILSAALH